ncbi:MAG: peptide chain release factor 1 [bacterium]|nr:peptide chain release factor 1 [bacterium]
MIERLKGIKEEYDSLMIEMSKLEVIAHQERYQELAKRVAELEPIALLYQEYKETVEQLKELNEITQNEKDLEFKQMAEEETLTLKKKEKNLEERLNQAILPKDEEENKDVIMEIRAGTGGDESSLFVADLLRMYSKYADNQGWKKELMYVHPTGVNGFKEVALSLKGKKVCSKLRLESGVHRVQRVPVTESCGRIHTSAVTVAVLVEPEEVEITIDPNEVRVDVYRSSGPGGQSVNTTDSAVRLTHLATGLIVTCQDEKSQHKNKAKAMRVLKARLLEQARLKQQQEMAKERKEMIGSGDRSERIRTYNYPQSRVTDHRINLTLHKLPNIMEGELEELIEALILNEKEKMLKKAS